MAVASDTELIDTLWNVNYIKYKLIQEEPMELIDTLWNVNVITTSSVCNVEPELIDTLWNVNDISHYEPVKDWDTN